MADISSLPKKRWAILIGLDYYIYEECLQGCVRDVLRMKEYLEAGVDPVDITILTASAPLDSSSSLPLGDEDCWPTYSNVIKKLKRVIDSAKKGDIVYIHYSGHGSREKSSAESAHQLGNLALVLFENNAYGISYFKGDILASALDKMVGKGLSVTIILDCCFSGSVLRIDNGRGVSIRSVDYDPAIYFESRGVDYPFCDSRLKDLWFVNPDGYTILSASGPHEVAHELQLSNGERRGALSYFLLEALSALRQSGVEIPHESLYEYMRIRFKDLARQTPMRYGNRSFSYFGGLATTSSIPFVHVYEKGKKLCLDAGEAHGVHPGDTYALYPPNWRGDAVNQVDNLSVTARVDIVRCLTSDLANFEPETVRKEIGTGWRAKPLTSLSQRKISVRLPASVYGRVRQARAPEDQSYLHLCTSNDNDKACMFNVVLDGQGCYEILDELGRTVAGLPTMPANAQGAEQRLMDILRHLSRFKYAESIENRTPNTPFERSFSLVCSVGNREPSSSSVFDLKHGDTWQLEIENIGKTTLYVALYNFNPSWKIDNMLSESGHNGFWVLEPKGKEILPLVLEVPEFLQSEGTGCCEDIIKVFITSRATSFPSMILPELPFDNPHYRGQFHEPTHEPTQELLGRITDLFGLVHGHDTGDERWATRSFIIRTKMT